MPTIKLSDTETLQVIHHLNNLDMAKHLARKLQDAINGKKDTGVTQDEYDTLKRCHARQEQTIKDLERDARQDRESLKYLRDNLKQIRDILVLPADATPAYVTEQVGLSAMRDDILNRILTAAGISESDSVEQAVSVMQYRKSVTAAADKLAEESGLDSAEYIVNQHDALVAAQSKLARLRGLMTHDGVPAHPESNYYRALQVLHND